MLALQAAIRAASGCGFSSSAAIRFGGRFQTLLNHDDEDLHLGPARGLARVERRLGNAALEPVEIAGESLTTSSPSTSDGHERLPAHRLDRRAVERVDVDPLDLDALVAGGERDALDVRRERDPVDARCDPRASPRASSCVGTRRAGHRRDDDQRPTSTRSRSASCSSGMCTKFWP